MHAFVYSIKTLSQVSVAKKGMQHKCVIYRYLLVTIIHSSYELYLYNYCDDLCQFYIFYALHIKMSNSESQPRKVELMRAQNATTNMSILHITMKHVNTPTKQPYHIDIFIS